MTDRNLVRLGLRVEALDPEGVATAIAYQSRRRALSLVDCFSLALAHHQGYALLTEDRRMRSFAIEEGIQHHDLLWIIDQMHRMAILTGSQVVAALEAMLSDPRSRFRNRNWRGVFGIWLGSPLILEHRRPPSYPSEIPQPTQGMAPVSSSRNRVSPAPTTVAALPLTAVLSGDLFPATHSQLVPVQVAWLIPAMVRQRPLRNAGQPVHINFARYGRVH